ncbi:MAG: aspartate aminotransferase family protein, partial [Phycisphaerales bacterium]|nr:aspartate aminotransferase family protein [Phycisphaerales bacterium]
MHDNSAVRDSSAVRVEKSDQSNPVGDMPTELLRETMHRVADISADFLAQVGKMRVSPNIRPGDIRAALPPTPPQSGEPPEALLRDFEQIIVPNTTHWNHPAFMAYFASTGSAPGIVGEALAATINNNAMLWRTGPAQTELEEHVCDWLRQMMGLPAEFRGHINDTASIGSLISLAAARECQTDLQIRQKGMCGRSDLPRLTVYASEQAHSSIDKAVLTLGIGLENLRRIPTDAQFRMIPAALEHAVSADRAAGARPIAVVATVGTTSTTSVDPPRAIGEIARRHKMWFHIDAAHAGSAAICPEYRAQMDGLELGDSLVVNPHKWLFTPKDCSVLLVRDPHALRAAFSLVPEYLRTSETDATNLMDYGVQLGRRFRSLKLWFVIRTFGVAGLQERIRFHCDLARQFENWVRGDSRFELCAPVPFSTVCFRAVPP